MALVDRSARSGCRACRADDRAARPAGGLRLRREAPRSWAGSRSFGDTIDLDCRVTRWGTSSFDVAVDGSVAGEPRFTVALTLVSVDTDSDRPSAAAPIPDWVRRPELIAGRPGRGWDGRG